MWIEIGIGASRRVQPVAWAGLAGFDRRRVYLGALRPIHQTYSVQKPSPTFHQETTRTNALRNVRHPRRTRPPGGKGNPEPAPVRVRHLSPDLTFLPPRHPPPRAHPPSPDDLPT